MAKEKQLQMQRQWIQSLRSFGRVETHSSHKIPCDEWGTRRLCPELKPSYVFLRMVELQALVLRGALDVVDDDDFNGRFGGCQAQA
jgi:hypothetical protein